MNMGIEQYVYEQLGCPDIEIAEPVSYGVKSHAKVDWINADSGAGKENAADAHKLVLLGGCDLLQLASYCSTDRIEFLSISRQNDGRSATEKGSAFLSVRRPRGDPRSCLISCPSCLQIDLRGQARVPMPAWRRPTCF